MKITKFAQCCLLIEVEGKRILTDPGRFSSKQNALTDIDLILITHEHADHLHTESVEEILKNNPKATIVTNTSVGKLLAEIGVMFSVLEGSDSATFAETLIEAYDGEHVEIFGEFGMVQNTGYFIAEKLFYPGDAYTNPNKPVDTLALPVAGPWCKLADALNYALEIRPKQAFPVHDYLLNSDGKDLTYRLCKTHLEPKNIFFKEVREDESIKL